MADYKRPSLTGDLDQAEARLAKELRAGRAAWRALGGHNHYFLALALPRNRATVMRMASNGESLASIAVFQGVTLERVEDDLALGLNRLQDYARKHPNWWGWCIEYQNRVKHLLARA